MPEVIIIAEGVTEELFLNRAVKPVLHPMNVFIKPTLLNTSKDHKGGAISYGRFKFNVRNFLRQKSNPIVSCFLDLYALDTEFPGFQDAKKIPELYQRVDYLETALKNDIVSYAGCPPARFIPHIQPYEFEGLLFSDPAKVVTVQADWIGNKTIFRDLEKARNSFPTPEHINDNYETKPSKRLETILNYKKTLHGPKIAEAIGLPVLESECRHFRQWMETMRRLGQR